MLTAQYLSFIVILGMNLLAAVLVWAEYLNNRFPYLKQVAIGQSFALSWFLVGLWITFDSYTTASTTLSSITIFWAGIHFLAASLHRKSPRNSWLIGTAAGYTLVLIAGAFIPLPITELSWYLIFLLFLAMPVATVVCFTPGARWALGMLQLVIAVLLIFAMTLLGTDDYAAIGGFIYFIISILIPLLTIAYVITSVRLSRLEIARKERDYRVFFDSVKEVFFRSDVNGVILGVSPSIAQFGVGAKQIMGKKLSDYLADSMEFQKNMQNAIETMRPFEYRGSFQSASRETDCEIVATPIRSDMDDDCYLAGSIRNIHEKNLLERQLIDAQRYESLGLMAGGVAHDFNNILQGIVGRAEILQEIEDSTPDERSRHLNSIIGAAESAGHLCRQLLMYTGKDLKDDNDFDLGQTIREVVDMLRTSHSSDIEIKLSLPDKPVLMHGSKSQVSQIFLNLTKNALEAVGEKGTVSISLQEKFVGSETADLALPKNLANKDYLLATVADTGPGIDPDIRQDIYEPFFSTKPNGRGLGLAAISGILRAHNGAISLASEPGEGARFIVALPSLNASKVHEKKPATAAGISKKRILLAEDESAIREVAEAMLSRAGHQITVAQDGLQALELFEKKHKEFDLLITDIRMPGMDGLTLARRLKEISPALPIILATGYADISENLSGYESEGFQFIRKPFRSSDLLGGIEAAFSRKIQVGAS